MRRSNVEQHHEYVQRFLGEKSRLKRVPPFEGFAEAIFAEVMRELIGHKGSVSGTKLGRLLADLYKEVLVTAYIEDTQSFERFVPKKIRSGRRSWDRVRAHIHNALESVRTAQASIPREDVQQLVPGFLRFELVVKNLSKLEHKLDQLQHAYSAIVHPQLRTATEGRQAAASKHKLHHTEFPIRPGSAELMHALVMRLENHLVKFRPMMPEVHINKVIVEVLRTTKWYVTAGNIKTIRTRKKKKVDTAS